MFGREGTDIYPPKIGEDLFKRRVADEMRADRDLLYVDRRGGELFVFVFGEVRRNRADEVAARAVTC